MKWLSITKEKTEFLSLKKTKELTTLKTQDEIIKFIHKKNPHKGRITSLKFSNPNSYNGNTLWCIYYTEALNKNFKESDWIFNWNKENIKTFNGVIIIQTKERSNIDFNDILDFVDDDINKIKSHISINSENSENSEHSENSENSKSCKNSQFLQEIQDDDKNDDDDDKNDDDKNDDDDDHEELDDDDDKNNDEDEILKDEDADDDDENEEGPVYNYTGCDDEDSDKEESFDTKPKVDKSSKLTKSSTKRTNNVDTLEVEQNHVLEFEKYSYESDYIPESNKY